MPLLEDELSEGEAGQSYARALLRRSATVWESIAPYLASDEMLGREAVGAVQEPVWKTCEALLGHTSSAMSTYSPLFAERRDQGQRLALWALFSIVSDHELPAGWSGDDTIQSVDFYRSSDRDFVTAGEPPYPGLAGLLVTAWFPGATHKICVGGTSETNPLLTLAVGDLLALATADLFQFWIALFARFRLTPTLLPSDLEAYLSGRPPEGQGTIGSISPYRRLFER